MKIVEVEKRDYALVYEDRQGNGYSFHCDKHGAILWDKYSCPEITQKSLAVAKAKKWNGKNGEVVAVVSHNSYGICPKCGRRIYFYGDGYFGAFECECGKWYNRFGQELKNPKSWDWDDDHDENLYDELYNDWKDDSYKYWYEGWEE